MEKVKKVIKEEVEAVQITRDEFVQLAAQECADMTMEFLDNDMPDEFGIILPLVCSKYAAHLAVKIFGNDKEEKRESEEKKNA